MGIGELEKLLNKIADGRFGIIIRVKGKLWQDIGWIDFSLVAGSVEIAELRLDGREEQPESGNSSGKIVIIGEALDKLGLQELLCHQIESHAQSPVEVFVK